MKKKRVISLLVCLLMVASLLGACGTGGASGAAASGTASPPASADAPTDGEVAEISFMVLDAFAKAETDPIYGAIEAFNTQNPDIHVTLEVIPGANLKDKFTNAALAGGGPDVVSLDTGGWIVDAAAIGILENLSDRIEPIQSGFYEGPLQAGMYDNEYYAVPWYMNNCALFYNKGILAEAGVDEPPANWEELTDAIAKVTAIGKKGMSVAADAAYWLYPFFFQNESMAIDTTGERPVSVLDQPAAIEAFEYFCTFHTEYDSFPESMKDALGWDQVYAAFTQEECAFMVCGDWGQWAVESGNPDLDYGIAPLPVGKQGGTVMGGYSLSINKNSRYPDAAWRFVEWLTAKEQNDLLLAYGRIGARVDIDTEALKEMSPHLSVFIDQAPVSYARPTVKALEECGQMISDAFKEVYLNGADPQTALAECHEKINALMEEKYA